MTPSRVAALAAILVAAIGTPSLADIVDDWGKAVAPPPPELKQVTVEPATTALLLLDIMKGGCSARPRCIAAMPNIKRLHDEAVLTTWSSGTASSVRTAKRRPTT